VSKGLQASRDRARPAQESKLAAEDAYDEILDTVVAAELQDAETRMAAHMRASPIPDKELAENAPLFQTVRSLKRLLYLNELYRQILPVHGVVMQFGVRWGRDIAAFDAFRTIYEPFNISRLVVGFDTFAGFPSVDPKDGSHKMMVEGGLSVSDGYVDDLDALIRTRRDLDALPHLERCRLVQGDVTETLPAYLNDHPETIVALLHLDLDLHGPTKSVLEAIEPYLTRGSVVAFDELASGLAPGETEALRETWGLGRYRIQRSALHSGQGSYLVIE
jgi:hypothetical protein